jgi:hypothetical protein
MDYKLELVVVPVSDEDRGKASCQGLGWRPDVRLVQMTAGA